MSFAKINARLRGKVGQATDPEDVKGKWFFEVELWDIDATRREGAPIGPFGPYASEKEALKALRKACEMGSEAIVEKVSGQKSGMYFDMANGGVVRKWEEN